MYFRKGNQGHSGSGPASSYIITYIYVILSNAQAAVGAAGGRPVQGPALAAARWPGGPAGAGPGPAGGGSLLAGGEASVIDPAWPAESDLDSDRDNESDSPAGQG